MKGSIQFLLKILYIASFGNKFSESNLPSGIHLSKRKMVKSCVFSSIFTMKSPERPRSCHSDVFICILVHALPIAIVTLKTPLRMLKAELEKYRKVSQRL